MACYRDSFAFTFLTLLMNNERKKTHAQRSYDGLNADIIMEFSWSEWRKQRYEYIPVRIAGVRAKI
jgi:hypothetical protein